MKHFNRILALLLAAVLLLSLTACGNPVSITQPPDSTNTTTQPQRTDHPMAKPQEAVHTPEGTEITFKVLADKTQSDDTFGMNYLFDTLADAYTEAHPNVKFEVEYLSDEADERKIQLTRLRAEILANDGPDIFYLPSFNARIHKKLFSDPVRSMYNGMFQDVSAYYNADEALGKDALHPDVMASGTIGEARYILPLRYDFQTLLIDPEALAAYGAKPEDINGSVEDLVAFILKTNDPAVAQCATELSQLRLGWYGKVFDYEKDQLLISEEAVTKNLQSYRSYLDLLNAQATIDQQGSITFSSSAFETSCQLGSYIKSGSLWGRHGEPFVVTSYSFALQYALAAKTAGTKYDSYPLRATDCSAVANVSFWTAVGSGCDYPDVAYDFLRSFLTENAQWELHRTDNSLEAQPSFQGPGLPVRNQGMVEPLSRIMKGIHWVLLSEDDVIQRHEAIKAVQLTDADFPLLHTRLDEVRYDSEFNLEYYFLPGYYRYDSTSGKITPPDVDLDQAAADYIRKLEFFLAES